MSTDQPTNTNSGSGTQNNVSGGTQNNVTGPQNNAQRDLIFAHTAIFKQGGVELRRRFIGVPNEPAIFVGREDEMQQLRTLLGCGDGKDGSDGAAPAANLAIVAVQGMGGVGKTALATRLAWDVAVLTRFSGGVLWAGLGLNPSVAGILASWATALGVDISGLAATQVADKLRQFLSDQPCLIILDDLWGADGEEAARQLRHVAAPGCATLCTTRDLTIARHLAPNAITDVDALPPKQAAALLLEYCPLLAKVDPAAPARLTEKVGRLPLALALIGSFLADHADFASELKQQLARLEAQQGWRNLADRDRKMQLSQVIALSVDNLPSDAHRAAFAALAPFAAKPETFTIEAAAYVANLDTNDADQIAIIGDLRRRNLLERVDDERVAMHQLVADLANELAPTLAPNAPQRHAQYYLDLMNRDTEDWRTIEAEYPQIKQAWAWVSSTEEGEEMVLEYVKAAAAFQVKRAYWREQQEWIEYGLNNVSDVQMDAKALLLYHLGFLSNKSGHPQSAMDYYSQSLDYWWQTTNKYQIAITLHQIGYISNKLGDYEQALNYLKQALAIRKEIGDEKGEAYSLHEIGFVVSNIGDINGAMRYYNQALDIRRRINHLEGLSGTLLDLGYIYIHTIHYELALDKLTEALAFCQQTEDIQGEAKVLHALGYLSEQVANKEQAISYYTQALTIRERINDVEGKVVTLHQLGRMAFSVGNYAEAVRLLEQAVAICREIDSPYLAQFQEDLDDVRRLLGQD